MDVDDTRLVSSSSDNIHDERCLHEDEHNSFPSLDIFTNMGSLVVAQSGYYRWSDDERDSWRCSCRCVIAIKICRNSGVSDGDLIVDPSHCEKAAHYKWIQQMKIGNGFGERPSAVGPLVVIHFLENVDLTKRCSPRRWEHDEVNSVTHSRRFQPTEAILSVA